MEAKRPIHERSHRLIDNDESDLKIDESSLMISED